MNPHPSPLDLPRPPTPPPPRGGLKGVAEEVLMTRDGRVVTGLQPRLFTSEQQPDCSCYSGT